MAQVQICDDWMSRPQKAGHYWSEHVAGLSVRVAKSGGKTWYRKEGDGRRKFGSWPEITTAEAAALVAGKRGSALPTLSAAFEIWRKAAALRGACGSTAARRASALKARCADWLDRPVATIRQPELVARYLETAEQSKGVANHLLFAWRTSWAAVGAEWPDNHLLKAYESGRRDLEGDEIERVAGAMRKVPTSWLVEWHLFVLLTGLRRGDALTARRDNLGDGGWLRLPEPKGGASKAFSLPLPEQARAILARQAPRGDSPYFWPARDGGPRTNARSERLIRAGMPSPHTLRHLSATIADEIGTPEAVRRAILNHSPRTITSGYTHATPEAVRRATARIANTICERLAAAGAPPELLRRL